MRNESTLAIVLRRTNFGEADRIVNFLTPSGKIAVLARGARKQKSKLAGGIEVFSVNEIVLAKGRGGLRTLVSARMKSHYNEILKDFDRTDFAYRAIKIINSKSEIIDSADFFELLKNTFQALSRLNTDLLLIRAWFFVNLENICGEEINLEIDRDGNSLSPDENYEFDNIDRVFYIHPNGRFSQNHIKFLRLMCVSSPELLVKVKKYQQITADLSVIIDVLSGK